MDMDIDTVIGGVADGSDSNDKPEMSDLAESASSAAALLKALSHQGRLMIMCSLAQGDKTVSELEEFLGWRQAAVSQQLARLREDALVTPHRQGKSVVYSLADDKAKQLIMLLYQMYCGNTED